MVSGLGKGTDPNVLDGQKWTKSVQQRLLRSALLRMGVVMVFW